MKMKEIQSIMVAAMLLLATAMPSFAQEGSAVEARIAVEVAGTTPDNLLYGLDVALDRISLLIASLEGPQSHARRGLEIADERLAEAEVMAEQGNFEAMARAEHEHVQMLAVVKERIRDIEHVNATREIEIQIELERDVVRHRENVERFGNELEVSIEIEGNVTPEQIGLIISILNSLRVQTGEVEIEIEIAKGETRIEVMQQTGKSEAEVEIEVEGIERRKGLVRMEERAREQIEDAVEAIAEVQAIVETENIRDQAVLTLMERAQVKLEQAQTAFEQGDYGKAFGQAVAAERLAERAADRAEELIDEVEETLDEVREGEMRTRLNAALATVKGEFSLPPTGFTVVSEDIDIEDDTLSITKTLTTNETLNLSELKERLLAKAVNWEGDVSLTEDSLDFTMEKYMDTVDVAGAPYAPSVSITVSVTAYPTYTEMHYTIGITLEGRDVDVKQKEQRGVDVEKVK